MSGGSLDLRTRVMDHCCNSNIATTVLHCQFSLRPLHQACLSAAGFGDKEGYPALDHLKTLLQESSPSLVKGHSFLSGLKLDDDDDTPEGPETNLSLSDHTWAFFDHGSESPIALNHPLISALNKNENIATPMDTVNRTHDPIPIVVPPSISTSHPCENFPLPPLPVDIKHRGPRPCPVCYVPVDQAMAYMPLVPSKSPILKNLTYFIEENSTSQELNGGSVFGGYPSLQQRNESFDIKESMTVNCGFVKGKKSGNGTRFDIEDEDFLEMEKCHGIVVASAIFGNYDVIQHPKNVSETSKRTICFFMFVDEETNTYIRNTSTLDGTKQVGLWRLVVVRNLPYADARRNGKVPKLLLHRLFQMFASLFG
ncbi:hypothetical protein HPP92_011202 [Vanilla planifolia]|uniref:TOD1/MUCI70 glycosyltransferase-like domain-containing protein n=1 Tax=Vanilla planifolia TaxID=51239 RepID=A0A835R3T4_VANPL|nr:hypothetical protein HPP92_011202 [Vanilla planifolia]